MSDSRINADSYIVVQGWMITELNLKGNELLVFAIIHGFSQDNAGEFTGSLQYLMEWTGNTKKTVITALKTLVARNLIQKTETYVEGVKFCSYRCKNYTGVVKNLHRGGEKNDQKSGVKITPNNLSIYNLEDNLDIYIVEIVNYLNEKTGKKFSPNTGSTRKHITARLKEGRTIEDCKKVIDTKCQQWLGTQFAGFLRPETLFSPAKFENYLNETIGGVLNGSDNKLDDSLFGKHA